jgi:hypothetical protein
MRDAEHNIKGDLMKTRLSLLFFAAVILLMMAPGAMAQYCKRCSGGACVNAIRVFGYPICFTDASGCHTDGEQCDPVSSETALASEYTVAAVERVEEPQPTSRDPLPAPPDTDAHTP